MKKILFIVLSAYFFIGGVKSQTIFEALQGTKIVNFPFQIVYTGEILYDISELAEKIPIAISYKDVDGITRDTDLGHAEVTLHTRFANQNGKYYFHVKSNYTDRSISDYLVLMNTDGTVSDYLWTGLYFPSVKFVTVKDFRIDASGNITTYQINSYPILGIINPYNKNVTSFYGQRTDKVYQIANGKFVLKSTKTYKPTIYQIADLANDNKHIWEGTETPQ